LSSVKRCKFETDGTDLKRVTLLAVLAAGAFWVTAAPAQAASASSWCGTPGTVDRLPEGNPGAPVHEIYAIPSDGTDRLATEIGTQMQTDAELIDSWWRSQDPTRTPRFDTLGFSCGQQLDISLVKLTSTAAELQPIGGRFERILAGLGAAGFSSTVTKYVVYYDGPGDGTNICGEGGGSTDGGGVAIVFINACQGLPSSVVAAHELLHALGALPSPGPPHACPGDSGHPCDSQLDILYPTANGTALSGLTLDAGHDDYYAHSGSWFDVQDSRWLRHLDTAPVHLSVVIQGVGTVSSDIPGVACTASCESDWDANQPVALAAAAAPGMRFVRWSGGCSGAVACTVALASATTVTALFAPATFPLTISITGRGEVRTSSSPAPCAVRCRLAVRSYQAVSLRAVAAAGWRLSRWAGACRGTRLTCSLPMTSAEVAHAVFARRKKSK
jgi:Divergent InlB B-repeat domain